MKSQHTENTSGGDSRRQNQQGAGKQGVKGKGIAYEGGRQGGVAKSGPGRRYRDHGRPTARYVRQAGYLPPQELNDSYVMATCGINGLRNQEVGGHLDTQQKLMLEAFKSGEIGRPQSLRPVKLYCLRAKVMRRDLLLHQVGFL